MKRSLAVVVVLVAAGLVSCDRAKEERARIQAAVGTGTTPTAPVVSPAVKSFRGLDLTKARGTTKTSELPDLWEERPPGSLSFEMRKEVVCVHSGLDGVVFHVPAKNRFYVQKDPPGSSKMTFYGPFDGDPREVMKLDESPGNDDVEPTPASE